MPVLRRRGPRRGGPGLEAEFGPGFQAKLRAQQAERMRQMYQAHGGPRVRPRGTMESIAGGITGEHGFRRRRPFSLIGSILRFLFGWTGVMRRGPRPQEREAMQQHFEAAQDAAARGWHTPEQQRAAASAGEREAQRQQQG